MSDSVEIDRDNQEKDEIRGLELNLQPKHGTVTLVTDQQEDTILEHITNRQPHTECHVQSRIREGAAVTMGTETTKANCNEVV